MPDSSPVQGHFGLCGPFFFSAYWKTDLSNWLGVGGGGGGGGGPRGGF